MRKIKIPLILLGILGIYFLALYFAKDITKFVYDFDDECTLAHAGEFGDSAGAINALFSALAFFGVLWTLLIQKADSKEQEKSIKIDRFENTFFQMLGLQQDIVKDLYHSYDKDISKRRLPAQGGVEVEEGTEQRVIVGRELFDFVYRSIEWSLDGKGIRGLFNVMKLKGKSIYKDVYIISHFDHYFRHLYRIIKYVDETDLLPNDFDKRYQYTSIVRAQLSPYELIFLYYNCLEGKGYEKFKPLVEKYSLLKNIRLELLAEDEDLVLYREKFKSNYQEKKDTDFTKEYRQSAFVPGKIPIKTYKLALPWVLDINIKYYRTQKEV